jgi:xanthine dehydrogenase small subunit
MIEFILNNSIVRTKAKTGMTLLHFIREEQQLKGTKSGCKEGDCGACTVLSGTLNKGETVSYKSITSCLTPLANVKGKHIVTIEGLNLDNDLNVAQDAIKNNDATQCGFCTPGFVVSLSGLALKTNTISLKDSIAAISGNICRCTGYKSIERATHKVFDLLLKKDKKNGLNWLIDNNFIPEYFIGIPQKIKQLNTSEINLNGTLVAGGTDIYVQYADELFDKDIRVLNDAFENKIEFSNSMCMLSANTTVTDLFGNKDFNYYFPELKSFLKLISSEPIRNVSTIGGNFVNASPIGDLSIFFLALDSVLIIENTKGDIRELPLKEFFIDYKTIDLKENEIIRSVLFELPQGSTFFNFEKVSKRTHLDIASVNSAINIVYYDSVIQAADISIGGVAAIPKYPEKTVDFLLGRSISAETIKEAQKLMQTEITPISDIRGSEKYKRLLARQLFYAHFIKLFPGQIQLKNLLS